MTAAAEWLRQRVGDAPPELLEQMLAALPEPGSEVPADLAAGALRLLEELLDGNGGREDALPLLAADALLTHALEARALTDPAGLPAFSAWLNGATALGAVASAAAKTAGSGNPLEIMPESNLEVTNALAECRKAEKEQALFYRALAAEAESAGDAALSQRYNELHADEQHHVSRLSARLLELGQSLAELDHVQPESAHIGQWEEAARRREDDEVRRYVGLLGRPLDERTRALVEEILETERHHAAELGGKWTQA